MSLDAPMLTMGEPAPHDAHAARSDRITDLPTVLITDRSAWTLIWPTSAAA